MIFVKQLHVVVIIFIVRSTLKYHPLSFLWLIVIKQAKPTFLIICNFLESLLYGVIKSGSCVQMLTLKCQANCPDEHSSHAHMFWW